MKITKILKAALYGILSLLALLVIAVGGLKAYSWWEYRLPPPKARA